MLKIESLHATVDGKAILKWISLALLAVASTASGRASEPSPMASPVEPPSQTLRQAVPMGRLTIPDEIAPAVVPYLRCLYASRGVEIRSPDGLPQDPVVHQGADCASHRRQAADAADQMLRNQRRGSREERTRFVEEVLTSIDNFAAQVGAPPTQQSKANASN